MAKTQKIKPFLWFENQAEAAANFYVSVFKKSKIDQTVRHTNGVSVVNFSLAGQEFIALNGGPKYQFTTAVSFFVICRSVTECKSTWKKLAKKGTVLMPLDKYPWSESYGWVQDQFGLSWQIMLGDAKQLGAKIFPSFLFSGTQSGRAEEAVNFYTSIFEKSEIRQISRYGEGGPCKAGSMEYGQFALENRQFSAMDNPNPVAKEQFSEAISFVIRCKNQREVDHFWQKLTADGGQESQCAWLKDKFGVSWQVVPDALPKLLSDPATAPTAMAAMLQMKKIIIRKLTKLPKK